MERYIYTLTNQLGEIEYVGQSKNPNRRYYDHVSRQPRSDMGHGKFFGRTDLVMDIVDTTYSRTQAHDIEANLKKENGLEIGEVYMRKFTDQQANEIRTQWANGSTITGLARYYNTTRNTIRNIVRHLTYRY